MEISIIIPIYNTEIYLRECIESALLMRNSKTTEIILINDGSPDNSIDLCKEYQKNNENIVVVDKENEGLAKTRNCAIDIAKGEYILFLDSDDYYLPFKNNKNSSSLKYIYDKAKEENLDVLLFNYTKSENESPQRKTDEYFIKDVNKLVNDNIYTSSACTKLIKREVLIDNNIYFISGTLSEDILFSAKLLNVENIKIAFLNEIFYFYRSRDGSITKSVSKKHILDLINIIKELSEFDKKSVLAYAGFQYATLMININLSKDIIDKSILKEIKKYSYLLKYNKSNQIKIIYYISKILGVGISGKLLTFLFKIKEAKNEKN